MYKSKIYPKKDEGLETLIRIRIYSLVIEMAFEIKKYVMLIRRIFQRR